LAPYSVFRTWLRRWLGLDHEPQPQGDPPSGLAQRVSMLEEHVEFLAGALRRLRGRVTGSLRNADPARDGDGGGPVSDAPAADTHRYSNAWLTEEEHRRLARARVEAMGRDLKGDRS